MVTKSATQKTRSKSKRKARSNTQEPEQLDYIDYQPDYQRKTSYKDRDYATEPTAEKATPKGKSPMFMTTAEIEVFNPMLPDRHRHGGYPIRNENALAVAYFLLKRKTKKKKTKTVKKTASKRTSKYAPDYTVFVEGLRGEKGRYYISDNKGFLKEYKSSFKEALTKAKTMVQTHGGGSLFIDECGKNNDGAFQLVGSRFIEYKYIR